jgi:stress response protein YsnF
VSAEYGPRQEGDTLIVPVFEYVPVTEMRLMLKEEVRITKAAAEVDAVHRASVRREELVVERRDGASGEWFVEDGAVGSTPANAEKAPR